jgi:carbon-monoxide dehydrogenase medium subunit
MIPAAFDYERPTSLDEALKLVARHGEDARPLAGGHSLIPAMKLRLVRPKVIVDLARVHELKRIVDHDGRLMIGALVTHAELASSPLVRQNCPLLAETAAAIGDLQVRNKGTIGGSLAHADPAADWPAAILALDAEIEIAGASGRRVVKATEFFVDIFETAIRPGELFCELRVPTTGSSVAYVKTEQKASGFAVCGVAAVVDKGVGAVRVGITGVAAAPYRATAVEQALARQPLTPETITGAAEHAGNVNALADIHASAEYRAHLARVNTARALTRAAAR